MHLYDNDSGFQVIVQCLVSLQKFLEKTFFQIDNLCLQLGQGRSDDIRPDVEKCADNSIADHCERAFAGFKCFSKSNLQMIQSSVN